MFVFTFISGEPGPMALAANVVSHFQLPSSALYVASSSGAGFGGPIGVPPAVEVAVEVAGSVLAAGSTLTGLAALSCAMACDEVIRKAIDRPTSLIDFMNSSLPEP
jgi:hypothetical protein